MQPIPAIRALLAGADWRAALSFGSIALLLAAAIVLAGEDLARHIAAIEAWIANLGALGVLAFIGLFILATSALVPESVLAIMAGALFGWAWGFAAVLAGNLLAASVQYALSRRLLRAPIQRAILARPSLAAIQRAVMSRQLRLQVLLRLTPLNPATVSYTLGAAGVRFWGFLLACLAFTPHLVLEVYFGYAGKHLAHLAGRTSRTAELRDVLIVGGLIVAIALIVMISRIAQRALAEAVAADAPPSPGRSAA